VALTARCLGAVTALSALMAGAPSGAAAQSLGAVPGRDLPEWLTRWSPLNDVGSLPRQLPSPSPVMLRLLYPAEKIGPFWSGGNPGALAFDVEDSRNELSVARAGASGEYRRPLDPAASSVTRFSGMGWQPLGSRGAVAGGALFDHTIRDPSSMSDLNEPYSSSPLVATDTSVSALRTSRARLEGAGGWRLGGWGVGVALGYDTRTTATVAAPFVRRNRAVLPAATIGLVRNFRDGRFQAGLRAGWQGGEETLILATVGQTGQVFQLEGYRDVPGLHIGASPYFRRTSRETIVAGATMGGTVARGHWAAYADGTRLDERQTNQLSDNPPDDKWATTAAIFGGAMQFPFAQERAVLTVEARNSTVNGDATLIPNITGLTAAERETNASAELRLKTLSNTATALVRASILSEHRLRNDSVADVGTIIDGTTPAIALELGRKLSSRVMLVGGYAVARYAGTGTIPSAASRGPLFRKVFAPELDIATSVLIAQAVSSALRWNVGPETAIWVAGRFERLDSQSADRPFAPRGERVGGSISLGVVMSPLR
jgi:hypothetical protein